MTAGGSNYEFSSVAKTRTMGYDVEVTMQETCVLAGTTAATCSATVVASADKTVTTASAVVTLSGTDYRRFDVEITGGADKTANPTACSESAATSLNSNTKANPTASGESAASSLNSKTKAIWALVGVIGVASILTIS